jgi:hypothetical protein
MSLRHLVFHNFWLKFFSVALGTIIWMAIHFSIEHDLNLKFKPPTVTVEPAGPRTPNP